MQHFKPLNFASPQLTYNAHITGLGLLVYIVTFNTVSPISWLQDLIWVKARTDIKRWTAKPPASEKWLKTLNTLGELHARKVRGATLVTRSPRILCFVLVRTYIVSVPFNAATPRTVLVICKFQIHSELTLFLWIFWRIIFGDYFTFSWHQEQVIINNFICMPNYSLSEMVAKKIVSF